MEKERIFSVTYENERISVKNSLPYIKCVLHLSCVVHGSIYARFMGCTVNGFLPIHKGLLRFTKVGDSSEADQQIHRRKTAVISLQRLQSPPNYA